MPFAGNTNTRRDLDTCRKDYETLIKTQRYYHAQNPMLAPSAARYVQNLAQETKFDVSDQLAVVTGVYYESHAYYVAQELACLGAHVILVARKEANLLESLADIEDEALRRGRNTVAVHYQTCDFGSLASIKDAADEISRIAVSKYQGRLKLLVHGAGSGTDACKLTQDGLEYNAGFNFIGPHYFTKQLLPLLTAASGTGNDKPRVLFSTSIGHCLGRKFHPDRIADFPQEGGAPPGYIIYDKQENMIREAYPTPPPPQLADYWQRFRSQEPAPEQPDLAMVGTQVARSKLAIIADASHFTKLYPKICFVSYHPGSIRTDKVNMVGNMFRFSASQGARAALRAALDPDFSSEPSLQGAYLHCDGNPWEPEIPLTKDPKTGNPYHWEPFAESCYDAAEKLIAKLARPKASVENPEDLAEREDAGKVVAEKEAVASTDLSEKTNVVALVGETSKESKVTELVNEDSISSTSY